MRFKRLAAVIVLLLLMVGAAPAWADVPEQEGNDLGAIVEWVIDLLGLEDDNDDLDELGGYIDPNS